MVLLLVLLLESQVTVAPPRKRKEIQYVFLTFFNASPEPPLLCLLHIVQVTSLQTDRSSESPLSNRITRKCRTLGRNLNGKHLPAYKTSITAPFKDMVIHTVLQKSSISSSTGWVLPAMTRQWRGAPKSTDSSCFIVPATIF